MLNTKTIGNKIVERRKKLNISQAQLAEQLFISAQAVGKWERGESMPDIITLNRLAEIFNVDLNYFSGNIQPEPIIPTSSQQEGTAPERQRTSWNMSRGNWVNADFSGLKNLHEKFNSSNLQHCKFVNSHLSGLLLKNNHVDSCDFSNSDLSNSHIQNSNLVNNHFHNCSLKDAVLSGCHIKSCNFSGVDFAGTTIKSCSFQKNIMKDAVLSSTSFNNTDLTDIIFNGKLENCAFDNSTFTRVTFQNTILINTFFKCRRLKKIKFVECHADRLTYEFLKNGKADLSGVTLLTV